MKALALALLISIQGLGPNAALGAQAAYRLPLPEVETLPNGLKIAWFLSDKLPVVDLSLVVPSGYRDDPAGKGGVAELVSSVIDRGNAGLNAQQMARAVERLGATRYAGVDDDSFSVGIHGLAPDAPELLDLLAKIALQPEFPDVEVKRERKRIIDRWRHVADQGETLALMVYSRILTEGTSYGRGAFLSTRQMAKIGREDVEAYYKNAFTPSGAVLLVVGRPGLGGREAFRKEILARFGAWSGAPAKHDWTRFSDPRLPKARQGLIVVVDRPGLTQAQVKIGFRAPLISAPEHYALVVLNALLGEYYNSRLNSLIRDRLGLTYSIASAFTYSKDFAAFSITSATRNDGVGALVRKCSEVLKSLKSGPIAEDEVTTAKSYLIGGFPLGTSTLEEVATRWMGGALFGLPSEYLNEFVPKVEAVTLEQTLAAASKDIDLARMIVVIAGDGAEIEKSLKASKLGPVTRVSARGLMD